MNRRKLAVVAIGVVVATSAGAYAAGSQIKSPAEVASQTLEPDAALILVPVEDRVVSSDVVTRGTGRFGSPQKLTIAASALKPNPGLIAEVPLSGKQLDDGAVAVSGSGRPLFVLVGARPMSRDLGPGLTGDDVLQLEEALVRLGFDPGVVDGSYDEATEAGVTAWYAVAGFAPFTATQDQLAIVRTREAELATASLDVITAAESIAVAESALSAAQAASATASRRADTTGKAVVRARAEAASVNTAAGADVFAKQAALDALRSGKPLITPTAGEIAVAESDLAAARANESAIRSTGLRAVADAQAILDQAPGRLTTATASAATANAAAAAAVAARQATLDGLLVDPLATTALIATAQADLAAARAAADQANLAGVQAIADAQAVVTGAPGALAAARTQAAAADAVAAADVAVKLSTLNRLQSPAPATPTEIAAAERELNTSKANSDAVRLAGERAIDEASAIAAEASADVSVSVAAVRSAESAVANARLAAGSRDEVAGRAAQEADLARRRAGVQVPADELVFVASGPVRVSEVFVTIGDPVVGAIMSVTDALVHIDGGLALEDAGLVTAGMSVQIDEPDLGIATVGIVAAVAPGPGTNGVDGFHVSFTIDVADAPPNLIGTSVRLTIPVESSSGSVMAVPVSALTLAPDGSSRVQVSVGGSTEFITVTPGLSADGYVEVTSADGSLHVGDLVVIGFEQNGTSSAGTSSAGTSPVGAATETTAEVTSETSTEITVAGGSGG